MATCPKCGVNKLRKNNQGWFVCRRHGYVRQATKENETISEYEFNQLGEYNATRNHHSRAHRAWSSRC